MSIIVFPALGVGCFSGLEVVLVRSVASLLTAPDRQGALFSLLGAVDITVNLLSNVSTAAIYSVTVRYVRGAVFYVLGGFEISAFILFG